MMFELLPSLAKKIHLCDLPLCSALLEDEKNYPWLILVPRRLALTNLLSVAEEDRSQLWDEVWMAQQVLSDLFHPTQLNVASIGNKTPQLHIHVIARFSSDLAWPHTVWDHPVRAAYDQEQKDLIVLQLREAFSKFKKN
jgi:diadenosine tetraphosphate (Ap4A) HIT family hydrolase